MGKPPLDALSVVIREAVQNSWDARRRVAGNNVRVRFRIRELSDDQRLFLGMCLKDLPMNSDIGTGLHKMMESQAPVSVLEVADFGTLGLSGPESAEFRPVGGEPTHFVDFIRNIGKEHAEVDGGTYGFGKSSFYALSSVSTIYVDTRSTDMGNPVQRMMFAALGDRFTENFDGTDVNFTGRHWWGLSHAPNEISPVTDLQADSLRKYLGLPARPEGETGTTVGVLLPGFLTDYDRDELVTEIRRIVLANFWTKMIPNQSDDNRITFELEIEDELFDFPHPAQTSPFHLFVNALEAARSGDESHERVSAIRTGGKVVHLGYSGFMMGAVSQRDPRLLQNSDRPWSEAAGRALFRPDPVHHYAVMRSGELVVRYFEGRPLPNSQLEWAGVFITSGNEEVERAFASAEPPAHDDWNPQGMTDEPGRYVRAGLREIRREFEKFVTPEMPQGGVATSLGLPSSRLARMIPGLALPETESRRSRPSGKSTPKKALGRFLPVSFQGYGDWFGTPALLFRTEWSPGSNDATGYLLTVNPKVLLDGSPAAVSEVPHGLAVPAVLELSTDALGFERKSVAAARFDPSSAFELLVRVQHVEDLAITVEVRYEQI